MQGYMRAAACLLLLAACATRDSRLATVIDTLPGGIQVVHNTAPVKWADTNRWRYVAIGQITTGDTGAAGLGNPGLSAAMDDEGRVYLEDQSPAVIKVFDSTGRFVRTIGREGDGPGEYRSPILMIQGAHLIVQDPRLARITVFDTSGSLIRSFRSTCCYFGSTYVDDSSHVYVWASGATHPEYSEAFLRFALGGELLDTVWIPRGGEEALWKLERRGSMATWSIPGAPFDAAAFTPTGHYVHAWSADYRLAIQSNVHDTVLVFDKPFEKVVVPEAKRRAAYDATIASATKGWGVEAVARAFHLEDIPATANPIQSVSVDPDGFIHVQVPSADTTRTLYDVFDSGGIWQGTIRAPWPASGSVVWRSHGRILVRQEDADGLPEFVVYRLDDGGQGGQDRRSGKAR